MRKSNTGVFAGMMSGSSLDGLDLAVCYFHEKNGTLQSEELFFETFPFPDRIREGLGKINSHDLSSYFLMENEFSHWCAEIYRNKVPRVIRDKVESIGTHGHTVMHLPEEGLTVQMTNPWILSKESGEEVVFDFRRNDIAHGGQGAPLAPVLESYLLPNFPLFLNLGGIGNISVHGTNNKMAFDFCPVNQILNHLSEELGLLYDPYGQNAAKGALDDSLYLSLEALPYWRRSPPKSLDNGWVRREVLGLIDQREALVQDKLHTVCKWIADQLVQALQPWDALAVQYPLYVTGGGAHNTFLMNQIIDRMAAKGWKEPFLPSGNRIDSKEAVLVALLAYLCKNRRVNSFHWATGAKKDTINGMIISA
jgi:anhydro-N-acetylmuramic acid kinase